MIECSSDDNLTVIIIFVLVVTVICKGNILTHFFPMIIYLRGDLKVNYKLLFDELHTRNPNFRFINIMGSIEKDFKEVSIDSKGIDNFYSESTV